MHLSGLGEKGLNSLAAWRPQPLYVEGEVWQPGRNLTEFARNILMFWDKREMDKKNKDDITMLYF